MFDHTSYANPNTTFGASPFGAAGGVRSVKALEREPCT
jgi:hypothetical protein